MLISLELARGSFINATNELTITKLARDPSIHEFYQNDLYLNPLLVRKSAFTERITLAKFNEALRLMQQMECKTTHFTNESTSYSSMQL
jgi:hypothetical protein